MPLKVKLVGPLSEYLPVGSVGNEIEVEVGNETTTVTDLMKQLGLPEDIKCMVSINDTIVPIGERQARLLSSSDQVKIIPPLKGG